MQEKQNRYKSPALWGATISLIIFVLKTYFNIEIPQVDTLINMILVVAAGLGIVNNPTDKKNI